MFWLYERSMEPTIRWIDQKFGARPIIAEANTRALKAGYAFGETTEIFHTSYRVPPARLRPGTYRDITGHDATALGFGGALGLTASSGPGIALMSEALGLAVMAELPLVVVDVQRAGPSTGMPTK